MPSCDLLDGSDVDQKALYQVFIKNPEAVSDSLCAWCQLGCFDWSDLEYRIL